MEMSRQRLRPGMLEASTMPCPHCHGTGIIRSEDSLALSILRDIEDEGVRGRSAEVRVVAPVPSPTSCSTASASIWPTSRRAMV
jgi:ribonuclease E